MHGIEQRGNGQTSVERPYRGGQRLLRHKTKKKKKKKKKKKGQMEDRYVNKKIIIETE